MFFVRVVVWILDGVCRGCRVFGVGGSLEGFKSCFSVEAFRFNLGCR